MEQLAFYAFTGTCVGLVAWGLRQPSRIYQYPFLIGAIASAFLLPQAVALVNDPGEVSISAVNKSLLMGALCLTMAWLGYQLPPKASLTREVVRPLTLARVKLAALCVMAVSLGASYGMTGLPIEESRSTGAFTILAFFAALSLVSLPILLVLAIGNPRVVNWGLAAIAGYPLYAAAFLGGRRFETATLLIIVGMVLFFRMRIVPPRVLAVGGVLVAAVLIPVLGEIRGELWLNLLRGEFSDIPWRDSIEEVIYGDIQELRNAAAIIDGVTLSGTFGWGTGYWDAIVLRYVPGQVVGFDVKAALQFSWTENVLHAVSYEVPEGTTPTAIGDTFREFGYFGSLFFLLQGFLFRNLWYLATTRDSFIAQISYMSLTPAALTGVTHGSLWFIQGALVIALVLFAIYRFARTSPKPRAPASASSVNARNDSFVRRRRA